MAQKHSILRQTHTRHTHTKSHEHRILQSPSYGWDTGPGATVTQVSVLDSLRDTAEAPGLRAHTGDGLWVCTTREGAQGLSGPCCSRNWSHRPTQGLHQWALSCAPFFSTPNPNLRSPLRHYCLRKRPVSRWAASKQPSHTPGSGPLVPLVRTVLGLCCGCLLLQGWGLWLAGHCCRLCLLPGGLSPAHGPIHPSVLQERTGCGLDLGKGSGQGSQGTDRTR